MAINKELDEIVIDDFFLKCLRMALKKNTIPSNYYNFMQDADEAICIDKYMDEWSVYDGERGNRYNLKKYSNVFEACMELIMRITEDSGEEKDIVKSFFNNISKETPEFPDSIDFLSKSLNGLVMRLVLYKLQMAKIDNSLYKKMTDKLIYYLAKKYHIDLDLPKKILERIKKKKNDFDDVG